MDLADRLVERWDAAFPGRLALGRELVRRYGHITRVYHDLSHLDAVLTGIDLLADEADDVRLVRLAGWYHDAVYDVRRNDSEAASAELARTTLPAYDFDDLAIAEVERLVLLTATHTPEAGDSNGAVLCDADLAVLAWSTDDYAGYRDAVRVEFRHVPDQAFVRGRSQLLRQLLAADHLFTTSLGREQWEAAARANLHAELAELEAHTG